MSRTPSATHDGGIAAELRTGREDAIRPRLRWSSVAASGWSSVAIRRLRSGWSRRQRPVGIDSGAGTQLQCRPLGGDDWMNQSLSVYQVGSKCVPGGRLNTGPGFVRQLIPARQPKRARHFTSCRQPWS
jgi:hypothetical protein